MLCRHVDFSKIAPEVFNRGYEILEEHLLISPDATVARKLFDQSRPPAPLSLFDYIKRRVSELNLDLDSVMAASQEQKTEEVQLRDELRAGSHVLRRYWDRDEPPWGPVADRWEFSRVAADGSEELVMQGEGHDLGPSGRRLSRNSSLRRPGGNFPRSAISARRVSRVSPGRLAVSCGNRGFRS